MTPNIATLAGASSHHLMQSSALPAFPHIRTCTASIPTWGRSRQLATYQGEAPAAQPGSAYFPEDFTSPTAYDPLLQLVYSSPSDQDGQRHSTRARTVQYYARLN